VADPIRLKVITGQYQAPEGLLATGYCVMLREEFLRLYEVD
jgi:hypothetical protein